MTRAEPKIDGNEILNRIAAARKNDRDKVTLYLSRSLYQAFRDRCGELPASVVVEELLKQFVESTQRPRTGEKR